MSWQLAGLALAAIAVLALVAGFRRGARAFCRLAMPALFALFVGIVLATCSGAGGLRLTLGSPAMIFPLLAVEALAINGALVLARDGLAPTGVLPLLGALLLAALCTAAPMLAGSPSAVSAAVQLLALEGLWASFLLVALAAIAGVLRWATREGRLQGRQRFTFIVVHGASLVDGHVSPLLTRRLDCAVTAWERQGRRGRIIVSGGRAAGGDVTEAHAMAAYLRDRGVPKKSIVEEDRSSTTRENLEFSREIMDRLSGGSPYRVALVSSEFHVFRCLCLADRLGIDAVGLAAASRWDTWMRSMVRELGAVIAGVWWPFAGVALLWALSLVVR